MSTTPKKRRINDSSTVGLDVISRLLNKFLLNGFADFHGKKQEIMTTRGIQYLKQSGVAHQIVKYDHKEKGAKFAAEAAGFPLAQTIKTLVAVMDAATFILVLMPGNSELSMKKIAKVCGAKRAAMADETSASRLTGYLVGGISPFGTKKRLPVIMEAALQNYPEVMINAGQRGTMVKLAPADIIRTLDATLAALCKPIK